MYYVSLGAVRRRPGQALTIFVLAALAATVASAAAWYGLTVASRAAGAQVAAAPAAQRVVLVHRTQTGGGDPRAALDELAATVRGLLPLPGATPVLGLAAPGSYTDTKHGDAIAKLAVTARDGFCAQVRITGACPASASEVAISADTAQRLGLKTGDAFPVKPATVPEPVPLKITGVYQPIEPAGEYWADDLFKAEGDLDPAFTTLDTFRQAGFGQVTLACDLTVPFTLLRGDNAYDLNGVLNAAEPKFAASQLDLANPTGKLFDKVLADRSSVLKGILIALAQVVLLAWFAIGLAGRLTGRDRRADAALLKLRGSSRSGMLRLSLGQHLVPLAGGAALGWPAGLLAGWLVARDLPVGAELLGAVLLSAGAVLVVLLGGLAVLTVVDVLAHRAPVAVLLRRVPSARRDWRSAVVDVALIALAAAAVYQARSGGPAAGLELAAPALVALAVGLLLARLLRALADRAGGAAVRAGRLRLGLTAVQVSRQPGTDRVFALIVVAVAMAALTVGGYRAGATERAARADLELGAPRVLSVAAASRTELEYAVRRADPDGRYAMAAVVDTTATPPVLALDSTRLAAVATWRPEYGPPDALGSPPVNAPPLITGARISARVTSDRPVPTLLGVILQQEGSGAGLRVEFPRLHRGDQTVTAAVPACAAAPGCRLVSWQLFAATGVDGKPVTGGVVLRSLDQQEPAKPLLDTAALADVTRWRTDFTGLAVHLTTDAAGLAVASGDLPDAPAGTEVYAVDTPLPLPVVLAGPRPPGWQFDDPASPRFGDPATPVRVAATASVLPVIGSGILTDLDAVRRLAGDAVQGGSYQVWLSADAPPGLPDALRREGLTVLGDRTAAGRAATLAAERSVVTSSFGLLTVAVAGLLAAAMVAVVAAVDRAPLTEQLRALRVQGLSRRTARATAYAGIAALVLSGLVGGLIAALIARPVADVKAPPFDDGWQVIPPPGALGPWALAVAAIAGLLVLGVTAALSVRPLSRRLERSGR